MIQLPPWHGFKSKTGFILKKIELLERILTSFLFHHYFVVKQQLVLSSSSAQISCSIRLRPVKNKKNAFEQDSTALEDALYSFFFLQQEQQK